jgi:hypothetical protein
MKYKHIPSMAHNFGHSFVSLMNYVGEAHIVDEIRRVLAQLDEPLHINFLEGTITPATAQPDLLAASVRIYQSSFARHALSHDVDPSCIHQLELSITRTNTGITVMIEVQDDRGKQYRLPISQTAL